MLNTSERVSPCSARCSPRSVGRVTRSSPSPCSIVMSRCTRSERAPRGPVTWTASGSIVTVTLSGTGMGCLPILDIRLPDLRHDLAADAPLTGLVPGQHAGRSRDDRGAHAALDLRDAVGRDVAHKKKKRDPPQARDRRPAIVGVLERDADDLAG